MSQGPLATWAGLPGTNCQAPAEGGGGAGGRRGSLLLLSGWDTEPRVLDCLQRQRVTGTTEMRVVGLGEKMSDLASALLE